MKAPTGFVVVCEGQALVGYRTYRLAADRLASVLCLRALDCERWQREGDAQAFRTMAKEWIDEAQDTGPGIGVGPDGKNYGVQEVTR